MTEKHESFEAAVAAAENKLRSEPLRFFEDGLSPDELKVFLPILREVAKAHVGDEK